MDRGLAYIQSSVEEGSKGSRLRSLRAENQARISGAHWGGHGGQEMRSGLGTAWIRELFGHQVKSLDFILRIALRCCV